MSSGKAFCVLEIDKTTCGHVFNTYFEQNFQTIRPMYHRYRNGMQILGRNFRAPKLNYSITFD